MDLSSIFESFAVTSESRWLVMTPQAHTVSVAHEGCSTLALIEGGDISGCQHATPDEARECAEWKVAGLLVLSNGSLQRGRPVDEAIQKFLSYVA